MVRGSGEKYEERFTRQRTRKRQKQDGEEVWGDRLRKQRTKNEREKIFLSPNRWVESLGRSIERKVEETKNGKEREKYSFHQINR